MALQPMCSQLKPRQDKWRARAGVKRNPQVEQLSIVPPSKLVEEGTNVCAGFFRSSIFARVAENQHKPQKKNSCKLFCIRASSRHRALSPLPSSASRNPAPATGNLKSRSAKERKKEMEKRRQRTAAATAARMKQAAKRRAQAAGQEGKQEEEGKKTPKGGSNAVRKSVSPFSFQRMLSGAEGGRRRERRRAQEEEATLTDSDEERNAPRKRHKSPLSSCFSFLFLASPGPLCLSSPSQGGVPV